MTKILIIYEKLHTTIEVNLSYLNDVFADYEKRYSKSKDVTKDDLEWCDICYAIRPDSIYSIKIAKAIVKSGRAFFASYDDDLLNLPKGHSSRWRSEYVLSCIKASSVIFSSNPLIISDYKKISPDKKFMLTYSHVRPEEITHVRQIRDKVQIVYAAGKDHTRLFDEFIKPYIDWLYDEYDNKFELTLIGINPELKSLKSGQNIKVLQTMPYDEYKVFMRTHQFDIGLAPLHNTPFSNRKYYNKFIEYTIYGIVGIYSNVKPYTFIVKQNENGILVDNKIDSWRNAICKAIERADDIKRMANEAQLQMLREFSLERLSKEMNELVKSVSKINYQNIYYSTNIISELFFECRSVFHRVWSHIMEICLFSTIKGIFISYGRF